MPIFEYRCQQCGRQFEQIVWKADAQPECPGCGTSRVNRLVSSFAVAAASSRPQTVEAGPCPCGAPQRGMCGE